MRTQRSTGTPGTVHVLPVRADRPAESVPPADRPAAGQVVYLPSRRSDDSDRWSGPVRRVLGITGGWLQAVPTRRQSGQPSHSERLPDRIALRSVQAARRGPRIVARPADREIVPAAFRPVRQPGTRNLVLLSQEI